MISRLFGSMLNKVAGNKPFAGRSVLLVYKTKETSFKNNKDMKKKFAIIALALVAAFGVSASAQNAPGNNKKNNARCEQQRPDRQNRDSVEMAVLFEGITLTPEQQTKIQNLRDARKQARADRAQQAAQQRADRRKEMRDAKRQRLADMKEILTPEQYVVYLENIVVSQPENRPMRGGNDGRMARAGKHGHDLKAMRSDRGARQAKPMQAERK